MVTTSMILFLLLGLFAGSLAGLLGIGGGVVLIPALVFLFGLPENLAQGTTLALMVPPIGLLAAWQYYRRGYVDLRIAGLVCLGFAGGGYLGAVIATAQSNAVLERIFGIALLVIALKMLYSASKTEPTKDEGKTPPAKRPITLSGALLLLLLGVFVGAVSGLIGIGGGVLLVPALVFFFGMEQHEAQGTTLALLVPPIGLLAAWQYYQQGCVNLQIAALVCIGFFLGGLLGANLATRMSNRLLAKVFGAAMLFIAVKMLLAA